MPSAAHTSERTYVLTVSFVHALVHVTELTFAGVVADRWGTNAIFSMLAIVGLVGTVLALALVGITRRRRVASTAGGEPGGG
ncbi:MAG: hypothetical protein O7A71_07980 [Chloroflexi bacterium]|nr:hypothetical protein [Chloroflexota bacterium]